MQLDTGAIVSILPKVLYDQQFNQWPLSGMKIKLKAYNGVRIPVYGEVHLPVVYEQQELVLPLTVVDEDCLPLLGRNWLEQLKLNWCNIFHVGKVDTLSDVLDRHKMVFDKGLGTIKGFTAEKKVARWCKTDILQSSSSSLCTAPKSGRRTGLFGEDRSREEGGME